MKILHKVHLKDLNSFGLDYNADSFVILSDDDEAFSFFKESRSAEEPIFIMGGGSNVLFTDNFHGTIIYPDMHGIRTEEETDEDITISAGSGIIWDKLVEWTVKRGLGGLENLSLIPGNTGASAVQNIGAYGVEVKDVVVKVKAVNTHNGNERIFSNPECGFAYRNSIFKGAEKGNYLITRTWFKLNKIPLLKLDYGLLKEEVEKTGSYTLKNTRESVIRIRRSKLPDPEFIGNAGSFFRNPVVNIRTARNIKSSFPGVPLYEESSETVKLAAGWLIEQCGWKGKRFGDAGIHDRQALVLVNHGKASGREIYDLSERIRTSVFEKFGITLEREVEIVGPI